MAHTFSFDPDPTLYPIRPNPAEDRARRFCQAFRELAETIQDAERYGTAPGLERRYARVRAWLLANYRAYRPTLAPHFPASDHPSRLHWPAPADPIDQLVTPPTLHNLLHRSSPDLHTLLDQANQAVATCYPQTNGLATPTTPTV